MKRLYFLCLLLVVLAAIAFLEPAVFDARVRVRKNVLLVTVDSLRADHVGCYGDTRGLTPTMDRVAHEGICFEHAISQASWTWPSLHSLLTSTYVTTHGAWFWNLDSPRSLVTLPVLLANQGYACSMVTSHGGLVGQGELTRAMDPVRRVKSEDTVPTAVQVLQCVQKRPFFVWVHLMDTHVSAIERDGTFKLGRDDYPRRYERAVTRADQKIGALVRALEDLGLYENTMIVITSDHGEILGTQEQASGHGTYLYEELIRVPLILAHGGGLPQGVTVAGQVEHVDIAPSVCALLRLEPPSSFEGRSLVPLVREEELGRELTFSEHVEYPSRVSRSNPPRESWTYIRACVRTGEWKLVETTYPDGRVDVQFFHLAPNPREETNLAEREKDRAAYLRALLDGWRARPRVVAAAGAARELDDLHRQQLRNLHYAL